MDDSGIVAAIESENIVFGNDIKTDVYDDFSSPDMTKITLGIIGEITPATEQIQDAYNEDNQVYDFSYMFSNVKKYIRLTDICFGTLEVNFAGDSWPYQGYPSVNSPDAFRTSIKRYGCTSISNCD